MNFTHKAYRIKSYFELTDSYRKKLLDDFLYISAYLQKNKPKKNWYKIKDEELFKKEFEKFWMSKYYLNQYLKAIGSNRVVDTFLNDDNGIFADLREKNNSFKDLIHFNNGLIQSLKLEVRTDFLRKYPLDVNADMINKWKLIKYRSLQLWLPVQLLAERILAHRSWWWKQKDLITDEQLNDLFPHLQDGDILLQRTNFQITNATLPGFWTHTMIYVGKGKIVEATPNKVRKVDWKKTASSDYLAVLRTKLDNKKAVDFALEKVGKPYDFNFDFLSDNGLVCSELVLKAYPGLKPKLDEIFGRLAFPPTKFVEMFNQGKFELIYFLDSIQRKKYAVLGTEKEFSKTHLRSKWDLLQK